jgi:membrane protease YdiL (CAAX protease family)
VTDEIPTPIEQAESGGTILQRMDRWMASNPWHPRITPFMAYILLMIPVSPLRDNVSPWLFPVFYGLQCLVPAWLMWRYRRLLPELNFKFHWTAIVAGLFIAVMWIVLAQGMMDLFQNREEMEGYRYLDEMPPVLAWTSMVMRLIGMSLIVPLFEELWTRSLLLRSFHSPRATKVGLINLAQDMPVLDDLIGDTRWAREAAKEHGIFTRMFQQVPLGQISLFAVMASSVVFMLAHHWRDWPGCLLCGVTYCLVVGYTNRGKLQLGLGPAVWAHGITNAMLWGYTLYADQWYYLP